MQNLDDLKDTQILGANVRVILDGFGSFTLLASKILLETGLGTMDAEGVGMAVIDPEQWYPLDRFLRAFQRIGTEFGDFTLRQAGSYIPQKAKIGPGFLKDLPTAFRFLDLGYHLNHAKNGKPMGDPQTGEMVEGIGHFNTKEVPGKKQIICEVDTPYPCSFDEGICSGIARLMEPTSTVMHDKQTCRKRGADRCIYYVNWK
ncbi:MAG: hypothetical protein JXB05_08030 [Myxococcaceae bacterium]|nr:hypothetical protein [Myxococcaceae bacterium]